MCEGSWNRAALFLVALLIGHGVFQVSGQLCMKKLTTRGYVCSDTQPFINGFGRCARSSSTETLRRCGFVGSSCRCRSTQILSLKATLSNASLTDSVAELEGRELFDWIISEWQVMLIFKWLRYIFYGIMNLHVLC